MDPKQNRQFDTIPGRKDPGNEQGRPSPGSALEPSVVTRLFISYGNDQNADLVRRI